MDFKVIRSADTKTSSWSGGTTTELYIFPESSSFQQRDFLVRISRATVEIQESDFTPLPGVRRTLMVLEGSLKLMHKNHHESSLEAFEQDSFLGDWNTKSIGKVTDFNLMLREGTKGTLAHLEFKNKHEISLEAVSDLNLFYVVNGTINFEGNNLLKGDVLVLKSGGGMRFTGLHGDLIHVSIQLNN